MKISKTMEAFLLHDEMDRVLEEVDFRMKNKTEYPVGLILLCALVGVTMGANSWNDIAYAAELRRETLLKYYPGIKSIPSHDTLRRFFSLVSTDALEQVYRMWARTLLDAHFQRQESAADMRSQRDQTLYPQPPSGMHVALDGKTNHGAMGKKGTASGARMHILSAFAVEYGICLGQRRMEEKKGEITNLPMLIDELNLGEGDVVTIDAIGTQKKIAKAITDTGADYILEVKANQRKLKEAIEQNIMDDMRHRRIRNDEAEEYEDSHGRMVHRHCFICSERHCLGEMAREWAGLRTYGVIHIERTIKSTGERSEENHYFISSLGRDAKTIMKYKRAHWGIENNLHWMLDVQYGEDEDRKRFNSAQNFALINKMVMAILKLEETKQTQGRKRMMAAADTRYLEKVINLFIEYFGSGKE